MLSRPLTLEWHPFFIWLFLFFLLCIVIYRINLWSRQYFHFNSFSPAIHFYCKTSASRCKLCIHNTIFQCFVNILTGNLYNIFPSLFSSSKFSFKTFDCNLTFYTSSESFMIVCDHILSLKLWIYQNQIINCNKRLYMKYYIKILGCFFCCMLVKQFILH